MHITKDDVPRVRFLHEAPWESDPPGALRLTATLFDGRLFFQQRIDGALAADFVRWTELSGNEFTSPGAVAAFRALALEVLTEIEVPA